VFKLFQDHFSHLKQTTPVPENGVDADLPNSERFGGIMTKILRCSEILTHSCT